ncbi:GNAT family N-acetyltransferase [Pseudoroseicyclus sp. H15]
MPSAGETGGRRIRPLVDCVTESRAMAKAAARLLEDTWPDWYGPTGAGDAAADVAARSRACGLPYGIAAVDCAGRLVGLATLAEHSHGANPGEALWLNGLTVSPEAQRQGIGEAMIARLEAEARKRGATQLFCTTQAASGLLLRRGWRMQRDLDDGWAVYAVRLQAE